MPWQMPENEQFIYEGVVARNEYHLPKDMKGWKVLDVGAHVGCFAKMCIERNVESVHSYEPCKAAFKLHLSNVATLNPPIGIHSLFRKAVVGERYIRVVHIGHWPISAGNSLYWGNVGEDVEAIHIDTALSMLPGPCDLLKLDCEGSEYGIIAGSNLPRVKRLAIEFHISDEEMQRALRRLETLGFKQKVLEAVSEDMGFFRIYLGERVCEG